MTTAELTAEINSLTNAERRRVGLFIASLKRHRKTSPTAEGMTRSEMIKAIRKSHAQASKGKTKSAFDSLEDVRKRYEIPG